VSLLEPGALEAEPYRALRHLVEQRRPLTGGAVLVVTSPGIGDGKTTTAINLAGALAQDPKTRVLLVEADLRGPALATRLGLHGGGRGLVAALLDPQVTLEAIVEPCPPFNLDILRASRQRGAPYELLASPRFAELIGEARHRYDYVLIDSPPLVPFPDGRIVGSSADGYLLVVCAGRTPRKLVDEALGLLDPAKLVGLVFNGEERSLTQYYYPAHRPAAPAAGRNGHAGRGWLAAVLPRRRARRDRAAGRELWS
jgi:capsular exopolysaccharide synthesis family protein